MDEKCRLCLQQLQHPAATAKITDDHISEKIKMIFNFPINTVYSFPSSVCPECVMKVGDFHTYYELVKHNQEQLWAVQEKYFEEVKVESTADCNVFEMPFENGEPLENKVCPESESIEPDYKALSDDEKIKVEDNYSPPSSPCDKSDDSGNEEENIATMAKSLRSVKTRSGRPAKGAGGKLNAKKKAPARNLKATDETNQRLQEFYDMKCEICGEKLESFTALKNHYYKQHKTQGYIKCCGRTFHSRYRLLEHLSYHVGASMVRCEICDKSFSSRSYLLVHKSRIHGQAEDRPFKCTQCHQSYAMECHLKAHIVSHVRVNCKICGKELASALSLRTHMINMHGNRENHICDSCGKEFRSRQAFERHVKLHKGVDVTEQMQCTVCSKWLNSKRALKMHVKLVHMEAGQTFQCDLCSQQCPNSRALTNHKQRVHVAERFKCEECGKQFKRHLYLKEHVAALHTRKPLYSCEVCGATFNSNANKYSHRKNKHPVEWEARRKQQEQQNQPPSG